MQLQGKAALVRKLLAMSDKASGALLRDAVVDGAEPIRARAAQLARRAPGAPDIADHIVISRTRRSHPDDAIAVAVGPSTEERGDGRRYDVQGLFGEFGTRKTGQWAFMRPALDSEGEAVGQDILQRIWRALGGGA